jgi:hypothetical protein
MTPRLGKPADGTTVTDWDEEEIARKITIHTGLAYAEWQAPHATEKTKINFLDTPGFSTFINDCKASLIAADAALILVDAAAGVQVVTEKVWDYATEYNLPRAFVFRRFVRSIGLGGAAERDVGRADPEVWCGHIRSRLAAKIWRERASVVSRRLLLLQRRREPQRQYPRNILCDNPHASNIRALSIFQLDEPYRSVRRSDAPPGQEIYHPQRRARTLSEQ